MLLNHNITKKFVGHINYFIESWDILQKFSSFVWFFILKCYCNRLAWKLDLFPIPPCNHRFAILIFMKCSFSTVLRDTLVSSPGLLLSLSLNLRQTYGLFLLELYFHRLFHSNNLLERGRLVVPGRFDQAISTWLASRHMTDAVEPR